MSDYAVMIALFISNLLALWRAAHYRKLAQRPVMRRPEIPSPISEADWRAANPAPPHSFDRGLGKRRIRDLRPGDEVFVWAHDRRSPLEPERDDELWKNGIIDQVIHSTNPVTWRSVTLVFRDRRRVYAMPEAATYVVAREHRPVREVARLTGNATHDARTLALIKDAGRFSDEDPA